MPSSETRHRLEIPQDLWNVLDQAAKRSDQPTSVLAAKWLWEMLEQKAKEGGVYDGLHAPQPYDRGWREYPRRGR